MSNTYSKIYLQFVFAVSGRKSLIPKPHKEELHKYMTALVQARKGKMLAVHCMPDHAHLFVGFDPSVRISDFVKQIKVQSNQFVRSRVWGQRAFQWQEGYGVFSYAHSQIPAVCNYIHNQEMHHRKKSFREEYLTLLKKFEVPFDHKYLFDWVEDMALPKPV